MTTTTLLLIIILLAVTTEQRPDRKPRRWPDVIFWGGLSVVALASLV